MTPEEKQKLYDAIGYEGDDTSNAIYPKDVSIFESLSTELNIFFSMLILIWVFD